MPRGSRGSGFAEDLEDAPCLPGNARVITIPVSCPPHRRQPTRTMPPARLAFRRPGRAAPRTWSAARSGPSRLWFTLGFGIVNEVYYPRVDIPQIRDLGFIVAGPDGFWSEVKRNQNYRCHSVAPGVPAVEIRAPACALRVAPAHHARPAARRSR